MHNRPGRRTALVMIGVACAATLAGGSQAPEQEGPRRRAHHAMVYDAARERVLLIGGSSPHDNGDCCLTFDDVWAFDGTRWTELASTGRPRSGQAVSFDAPSGAVLAFGGYANGQSLDELLRWNGRAWESAGTLAGRLTAEALLVHDAARRRHVLFGGSAGRGQVWGDTWEYDGATWTRITEQGPPARQAFAMAYDAARQRTVLFGGSGGEPDQAFGDTWEYDGTAWARVATEGPTPRRSPGAAWDAGRGLFIVFGGVDSSGFLADTWGWNGTEWRQLATTGPAPRAMARMAYDARRGVIVLFGGRSGWPDGDHADTWEWNGTEWRQIGR